MTGAPDQDAAKAMLRNAFERAYRVGHSHGRVSPRSTDQADYDAHFDFAAECATVSEWFAAQHFPKEAMSGWWPQRTRGSSEGEA